MRYSVYVFQSPDHAVRTEKTESNVDYMIHTARTEISELVFVTSYRFFPSKVIMIAQFIVILEK